MDRVGGSQIDVWREIANCGLDILEHRFRDRDQDPHAILDVLLKGLAQLGGLGPVEALFVECAAETRRPARRYTVPMFAGRSGPGLARERAVHQVH